MTAFVVDSSVIVAIIKEEPEATELEAVLIGGGWAIGWPTVFEIRLWARRNASKTRYGVVADILTDPGIAKIDFDGALEARAFFAFDHFGKGLHRASLNFGDCMAYAVAQYLDLPLLFKGGDFGQTDVKVHPASVILDPR